ncbi:MAG: NUMOD4 motif-containing HNH endonuclease [Sphingobacteriaceae bacterium]|nr:NUMOD4 motif-containing HNH endonuclease [Sphingobacteriaceae bacterium]
MLENWKDVLGYEGLYQVSDQGNVKSLDRTLPHGITKKFYPSKILKAEPCGSGYLTVCLYIKGIQKRHMIHRLAAKAFIPNPEEKRCVNHKDGIKTNNSIENLEWATHSENNYHAFENGLKKPSEKQRHSIISRNSKLVLDTISGVFFDSCKDAATALGYNHSTLKTYLNGALPNKSNLIYA